MSYTGSGFVWLSGLIFLLLLPSCFWRVKSDSGVFIKKLMDSVYIELASIMPNKKSNGAHLIFLSVFMLLVMVNLSGLLPYYFSVSCQLVFSFSMAAPLWLGHMFCAAVVTPSSVLAHLVPLGTPYVLLSFMVWIELLSSVMRPFTLSVRLMANMVAGHLLIALLGAYTGPSLMNLAPIILMMMMFVLELAVCLIQAYVFSLLSLMYVSEVTDLKVVSPNKMF